MASAMGQLLEVASSLLAGGSVVAESLITAMLNGFGLLMKLIEWILACSVQVVEFFPAVFEFLFAAGEWIVTAFVSLLTASFMVAQMVWYGLLIGLSAIWNGIVTGACIACSGLETVLSGLVMLPDTLGPMWNALVTGGSLVLQGLVIGGGAVVTVGIVLWNGLNFAVIAGWSVLMTSLSLLLNSFNALAYVTYELGLLIARVVQGGLRAAFSLPSVLFHILESESLFHQSWMDAIQNSLMYLYKYLHMLYKSFKLNVKFIVELPSLVLPDNVSTLQIFCTSLLIIVAVYLYVLTRKMKRKRGRNQTALMHQHQNITSERRPSVQRRAAHAPSTVSTGPTSNQMLTNRRKISGSLSPGQQAAGGSEDTGVNNMLEQRVRELELKLDREKEQQMCTVCLDNNRVWMLKPCNHYCVCDQCVHRLNNACPICRKVIRNKEKVFHA